ncbi:hypothetical protein CLV35_3062 [Motilibacter peucedani]|uniref:Uncharacterized protein n=1 Tax=Motilibacter peucedani TaxID=598650 RepID=A0A420XNF6_9ACTN|nr:hypothetical protein CLV35_3062 [Motilibacter peucedani]
MFRPWSNVAIIAAALSVMALHLMDVRARARRGEQGWSRSHILGVASMACLLIASLVTLP